MTGMAEQRMARRSQVKADPVAAPSRCSWLAPGGPRSGRLKHPRHQHLAGAHQFDDVVVLEQAEESRPPSAALVAAGPVDPVGSGGDALVVVDCRYTTSRATTGWP
jgi:hypothetical protein